MRVELDGVWRGSPDVPASGGPYRRGARQSRFEDPLYNKEATEDSVNGPHALAVVRRECGFNGIGTGRKTLTAGGLRESDRSEAEYSPRNS